MRFSSKKNLLRLAVIGAAIASAGLVLTLAVSSYLIGRELEEMRDVRRADDVSQLLAIAARDRDTGSRLLAADQAAPVIIHPTFSQVIVSDSAGVSCDDPARRPSCPGQVLDFSGHDAKCVADFGPLLAPAGFVPQDPATGTVFSVADVLPIGEDNSGYYIHMTAGDRIEIGSCWPETRSEIRRKK